MSPTLFRITRAIAPSRSAAPRFSTHMHQHFRSFASTTRAMAATVDSHFISQITAAEKLITKQHGPVKDGPTARAQSHVGQQLTSQVVLDITLGEHTITGSDSPVQNGPTAVARAIFTQLSQSTPGTAPTSNTNASASNTNSSAPASGVLDSSTISKITEKEKQLTGNEQPVQGGPTAKAQQHAGEPITSQALHDITEGEKKLTGGERVKGGPTSKAQSELGKSRS